MPAANPNLISRLLAAEFSWRLVLRTDRLTWISRALSLTGFAIAAYLTTVYLADVPPVCATSGGCVTVQHSAYANIAGIPVEDDGFGWLRSDGLKWLHSVSV